MENVNMCELSQKSTQVRGGRKFQFSRFFENEENHYIFIPGQLKYESSLI